MRRYGNSKIYLAFLHLKHPNSPLFIFSICSGPVHAIYSIPKPHPYGRTPLLVHRLEMSLELKLSAMVRNMPVILAVKLVEKKSENDRELQAISFQSSLICRGLS